MNDLMLIQLAADWNERISYSEVPSSLGRRRRREEGRRGGRGGWMARKGRSTVEGGRKRRRLTKERRRSTSAWLAQRSDSNNFPVRHSLCLW